MKKLLILFCSIMLLSACSSTKETSNKEQSDSLKQPTESNEPTNNGEDNTSQPSNSEENDDAPVIITIPIQQYEDLDEQEITEVLQEEGARNIQIIKNKHVTYELPKKQFNETKQQLNKQLDDMIKDIQSTSSYPSIQSIEVNNNYTHYKIKVNKDSFENSFDSLAIFSLAMSTTYYFSYIGDAKATTTFEFIDVNTKESYKKQTYPED